MRRTQLRGLYLLRRLSFRPPHSFGKAELEAVKRLLARLPLGYGKSVRLLRLFPRQQLGLHSDPVVILFLNEVSGSGFVRRDAAKRPVLLRPTSLVVMESARLMQDRLCIPQIPGAVLR